MQIYIAKPGGEREGPFTLEDINRDLAARKYTHNDYWAWHDGLPQWIPLHEMPGVTSKAVAAIPAAPIPEPAKTAAPLKPVQETPVKQIEKIAAPPEPARELAAKESVPATTVAPEPQKPSVPPKPSPILSEKPSPPPQPASAAAARPVPASSTSTELKSNIIAPPSKTPEKNFVPTTAPVATEPIKTSAPVCPAVGTSAQTPRTVTAPSEAEKPKAPSKLETPSGLPFATLEQIFIFTSGEGRIVFTSQTVARKLQEVTGESLTRIRAAIPVDVIGHANVGVEMMLDNVIPDKAWRAMFSIRPVAAQKAKDDLCHIHTLAFTVETKDALAVILFYNRPKP